MSLKRRYSSLPDVVAHSKVYPGTLADESDFIEAALRQWPAPSRTFDWTNANLEDVSYLDLERQLEYPLGPIPSPSLATQEWIKSIGARVHIGGEGGDQLFWSAPLPFGEGVNVRDSLLRYWWWTSERSISRAVRSFRQNFLRPNIPDWILQRYLRSKGFTPAPNPFLTSKGLELKRALSSEQRDLPFEEMLNVAAVPTAGTVSAWEVSDSLAMRSGIETRLPFCDAALIQEVSAIPILTHAWQGRWRAVQVASFSGLYPDSIRERWDKAEFSTVQPTLPRREEAERSVLAELGLVDVKAARAALDGSPDRATHWAARAVADLDLWLSRRSEGQRGL